MFLGFSLTLDSCRKDPCDSVNCKNGGTCIDGTCDCPEGYSGTECDTYDPCTNITCLNGGTCANGTCNCPTGYSGSDCGTELTPTSVIITGITVNDYPMTDGGAGWDLSSGPELYVSLNSGTTANTSDFTTGYYQDVSGQSLTFSSDFPVTIPSPSSSYTVGLWDYDTVDADDFMAGIYFTPNSYKSGFPSTITLSTSSMEVVMSVTWNF